MDDGNREETVPVMGSIAMFCEEPERQEPLAELLRLHSVHPTPLKAFSLSALDKLEAFDVLALIGGDQTFRRARSTLLVSPVHRWTQLVRADWSEIQPSSRGPWDVWGLLSAIRRAHKPLSDARRAARSGFRKVFELYPLGPVRLLQESARARGSRIAHFETDHCLGEIHLQSGRFVSASFTSPDRCTLQGLPALAACITLDTGTVWFERLQAVTPAKASIPLRIALDRALDVAEHVDALLPTAHRRATHTPVQTDPAQRVATRWAPSDSAMKNATTVVGAPPKPPEDQRTTRDANADAREQEEDIASSAGVEVPTKPSLRAPPPEATPPRTHRTLIGVGAPSGPSIHDEITQDTSDDEPPSREDVVEQGVPRLGVRGEEVSVVISGIAVAHQQPQGDEFADETEVAPSPAMPAPSQERVRPPRMTEVASAAPSLAPEAVPLRSMHRLTFVTLAAVAIASLLAFQDSILSALGVERGSATAEHAVAATSPTPPAAGAPRSLPQPVTPVALEPAPEVAVASPRDTEGAASPEGRETDGADETEAEREEEEGQEPSGARIRRTLHSLRRRALRMERLGRTEDAIRMNRSILRELPGDSRAHARLARLLMERGDEGASLAHARRAAQQRPDRFGDLAAALRGDDASDGSGAAPSPLTETSTASEVPGDGSAATMDGPAEVGDVGADTTSMGDEPTSIGDEPSEAGREPSAAGEGANPSVSEEADEGAVDAEAERRGESKPAREAGSSPDEDSPAPPALPEDSPAPPDSVS